MTWELSNPVFLLWALLPMAIAAYALVRRRSSKARDLSAFSSPAMQRRHTRLLRWAFRGLFLLLVGSLFGLAIIAARPVQRESWTERSTEGIDIVITLDVSISMVADDFLPSRIDVAKRVITDFIQKRKYDRIGLVIFGGEAMTKSPLTRDHTFLLEQVKAIQLNELKQGTAIGMGLSNALLRLRRSTAKTKIIVLLTDGDSNVGAINPVTAAQLARQEGIKIYPIGMGEKNRVIVDVPQLDAYGRKVGVLGRVPSYINPALLKEIAVTTGGRSYMARDSGMLARI
ncbi:VWA domain-containing protein, partial [bacterium]|nr:VWA domain-containing protein [bacterium]